MEENNSNSDYLNENEEISAIIKFLEKTKNGEYSEIDKIVLSNDRISSIYQTIDLDENYYYSIS